MGMSRPICPPSTPSPAPRAPLGSRGTRGRKEALCLGRGGLGRHPRGRPQPQECGETLRPWNQGASGAVQSCLAHLYPCLPPHPCWDCFLPLGGPFRPEASSRVKAVTSVLAQASSRCSPSFLGASARIEETGEPRYQPLSRALRPSATPTWCPGEVTPLGASVSPSVKCRAPQPLSCSRGEDFVWKMLCWCPHAPGKAPGHSRGLWGPCGSAGTRIANSC